MFRAIMQECNDVLRKLVATLLEIDESTIKLCQVLNPIVLGDTIDDKDCVLDLNLLLNDDTRINIELQMWYDKNWVERSLFYLGRTYAKLEEGDEYYKLKRTYQIGILNFHLFDDSSELYSEYQLINVENGKKYTDKLSLRILDLTMVNKVEENSQNRELLRWARIFQAKTMSELKGAVAGEEVLESMIPKVYAVSEEENIRLVLEARADYERRMKGQYMGGYEDGINETIIQMISFGLPLEQISSITGKTVEEIKALGNIQN